MEFLKEENANCCFLYHKETTNGSTNLNTAPGAASLLLNEFHYGDSQGSKGHVDEVAVDLTMDVSAAMESYAKDSRDVQGVTDEQDLLVAFAWVLPSE